MNGVFKSDLIVPEEIRLALVKAVEPLENIPDREKDWHPRSNNQVLDIVHPSLYPLVYGQTRILPRGTVSLDDCYKTCGDGQTLEVFSTSSDKWSSRYQWLPSDFKVQPESGEAKAISYINNLHPVQYRKLYDLIECVVSKAVPMWNAVLTEVSCGRQTPRTVLKGNGFGEASVPEPQFSDYNVEGGETNYDELDARFREWEESRPIVQPEPMVFAPGEVPKKIDLSSDFDGHLQIIVKLANIHLTPESPEYPGGSWHVEGQANEAICASALYYYSTNNVTDSYLAFRESLPSDIEYDLDYGQDDYHALETIFGFSNMGPAIQNLGSVKTCESRLLTFPNTMQHQVQPFALADRTKPGHRKLLALFLVDPHHRIISTANVPCQQKAWWEDAIRSTRALGPELPAELTDQVLELVDGFPVSLETAKQQRLELMDERSHFVDDCNNKMESNTFSVGHTSTL